MSIEKFSSEPLQEPLETDTSPSFVDIPLQENVITYLSKGSDPSISRNLLHPNSNRTNPNSTLDPSLQRRWGYEES